MPEPTDHLPTPPPGHRWIGTSLLSEEQIKVEGWKVYPDGHLRAGTEEQLRAWGTLVNERKRAKRSKWQKSMDEDAHFRELYPETDPDRKPDLRVVPGGVG